MVWTEKPTLPREPQTFVASSDEDDDVELRRRTPVLVNETAFCPVLLDQASLRHYSSSYTGSSQTKTGGDFTTTADSSTLTRFTNEKGWTTEAEEDEYYMERMGAADVAEERPSLDRSSYVTAHSVQDHAPDVTANGRVRGTRPVSHVEVIRMLRAPIPR